MNKKIKYSLVGLLGITILAISSVIIFFNSSKGVFLKRMTDNIILEKYSQKFNMKITANNIFNMGMNQELNSTGYINANKDHIELNISETTPEFPLLNKMNIITKGKDSFINGEMFAISIDDETKNQLKDSYIKLPNEIKGSKDTQDEVNLKLSEKLAKLPSKKFSNNKDDSVTLTLNKNDIKELADSAISIIEETEDPEISKKEISKLKKEFNESYNKFFKKEKLTLKITLNEKAKTGKTLVKFESKDLGTYIVKIETKQTKYVEPKEPTNIKSKKFVDELIKKSTFGETGDYSQVIFN